MPESGLQDVSQGLANEGASAPGADLRFQRFLSSAECLIRHIPFVSQGVLGEPQKGNHGAAHKEWT